MVVGLVPFAVQDCGHGGGGSIHYLLANLLGCGGCLLRHTISLDTISLIIKLAVCIHLVATVVADESDEVLDSSRAAVLDRRGLVLGSEKLDSGEALDLIWDIVGSSVNLGDGDLGRVRAEEGSEFLVLGSETARLLACTLCSRHS